VPDDVDLRVLLTFLEFYLSLLEFTNYKLYTDNNLVYPPKVQLEDDRGLGWMDIQQERRGQVVKDLSSRIPEPVNHNHAIDKVSAKKLESLKNKMDAIVQADDEEDMKLDHADRLFSSCSFWLNRETPISSMLFILKAFGAKLVAFDDLDITETDQRITHQVVDRDYSKAKRILDRIYIQPQWVYDCINAGKLLDHADYAPGVTLPPHLSPFVVGADRHGYTPMVELGQRADLGEDSDKEPDAKVENLLKGKDVSSAHALHQLDMEAEALGIDDADVEAAVQGKKKRTDEKMDNQRKDMAKMMMSRRDRRLYERMTFSNEKKSESAEKLEKRKKELSKKKKSS
jgi:pescadillo protein